MIDQSQLNALEIRVSQLINALRAARNKNEKIEKENEKLNAKIAEISRELDLLRENTHLITAVQEQNETFRKQRDALRQTLQIMLRRVSALRKALED